MSSSMGRTDGSIQKAVYQYNGLGHRMGQSIATGDAAPARTIRYTLDLTRQYHNLLQKTGNGPDQTYFWDGNVAGMEEEGRDHFYFQDDLGSPMRLTDETGRSEEAYGFDEFGNNIRTAKDIFQDSMQSFGFTGYQMDSAGGLYFAQARRYDAGAGRFVSEDFLKGHIAVPYTMNHYSYCWNRPMNLVDLNGMWPSLKDIGKGIKNAASSVGEGIKNFYYEHRETIDTIVKVTSVVATTVAIGAVVVGTGGTAAVFAAGVLSAGTVGGFANECAGGSYTAGFIGGSATGTIQTLGSFLGPVGNTIGGTIGSGIGTYLTEKIDNGDPRLDIHHEDIKGDVMASTIMGGTMGMITGSVQFITEGGDEILKKSPSFWNDIGGAKYSNTTGNVLNTFYGAITAGLANESSFENQGISIESENNKSEY